MSQDRFRFHEVSKGTFIYEDTEVEGRYICPACHEGEDKTITLKHEPAWSPPRPSGSIVIVTPPRPERYVCPKCDFKANVGK